jgi:hypothetical protein
MRGPEEVLTGFGSASENGLFVRKKTVSAKVVGAEVTCTLLFRGGIVFGTSMLTLALTRQAKVLLGRKRQIFEV